MTRSKLLTIEALKDELDLGKATLKFILHRFGLWLAPQVVDDETCYTEQAVTTLLKIKKFLDAGMLPEQVEAFLAQEAEMLKATASVQHSAGNQGTIPVGMESVSILKDMFQVFIEKQDRIALAQEALARVEEKKADAMEKRAAAEEKKADAMTNIALALQEMNQRHSATPQAMEIAERAVETLALEESVEIDESPLDTSFSVSYPDGDLGDFESLPEETQPASEIDNLSDDMDDLSKLVNSDVSSSNSPDIEDDNEDDLDDLFSFVDLDTNVPENFNEDLDDLDDLSKLIEPVSDEHDGDLDDLSALIDKPAQPQEPMDDLSLLVNDTGENSGQVPPGEDSQIKETPSIKPDLSPDQDMKKYKSAVMKIIIELKEQGLTAQQTTDRFNRDGVATLSGKPAWGLKAMEKIYGFIDSAN